MPSKTQQELPYAAAEAGASERLVQLGRALWDVRADDTECMLARLIFDQTASGVGPAWSPAGGTRAILGHAWGCRCALTKFKAAGKRLRALRLIEVGTRYDEAGRRKDNFYRINWAGVYAVRGLPCPDALTVATRPSQVATRPSQVATRPSQVATRPSQVATRPTADSSTTRPRGRAEFHADLSVLSVLSDDDDKTKELWPAVAALAKTTYEQIFSHQRHRPLDAETREFLFAVALSAKTVMPEEWLARAARIAGRKRAENPPGFLKRVLENHLIEQYALAGSMEEAAVLMGKMLAAARPIVARRRAEKATACP